jgi:hypothetical protein
MHVQHAVCTTTLRPAVSQLCEGVHAIRPPCNALSHKSFVTTSPRSVIWGLYHHPLSHNNTETTPHPQHPTTQVILSVPGSLGLSCCPAQVLLHCHLAPQTQQESGWSLQAGISTTIQSCTASEHNKTCHEVNQTTGQVSSCC